MILRLALSQWGVGRPDGLPAFAARLDAALAEAAGRADLLVLPEYAAMELASAFTVAPEPNAELKAAVDIADPLLEIFRQAARRHQTWLLPGTLPMRSGAGIINRAPLISPAGHIEFQDKRVMTRFEAESWGVAGGAPPSVFETPWGRIGIAICYDLEFPPLVRAQVEAGAWVILAPSCTDTLRGFNRVFLSARARALENQCFVAVSPTVGDAPWSATLDINRGFAAVTGPVDRGFPDDGVLIRGGLDEPGWVFATLDKSRLDRVREDGGVRNHRDWPAPPPPSAVIRLP
jgi:predicted amidohydrolase